LGLTLRRFPAAESISERTVPDTLVAPSGATLTSADSWQGLNAAVLAEWLAREDKLLPPPTPPLARTKRLTGFQVIATGSYAPEAVVSNDDLQRTHGFDPQWIAERTGIIQRRHAPAGMAASDLCREACLRCLQAAGAAKDEVDLLIVATHTPDLAMPGTACLVQEKLGLFCGAFDVQAACAGFMYALAIGAQFVRSGNASCCLVVGADVSSRIVNPADQYTYPLFGDGAGAVLLAAGKREQGFLAYQLGADGSGAEMLGRPVGGSRAPLTVEALQARQHYFQMNGRAVFRWAVETVCRSAKELLQATGLTAADIALFVPHQANQRILASVAERLGLPAERVYSNVARYGNTMAGSIPLALDEAAAEGRIQRGDRILLSGFGAGLSWGSALVGW
jgi:3-oxoacyl-[acyl-carrier-protein] synthase-3